VRLQKFMQRQKLNFKWGEKECDPGKRFPGREADGNRPRNGGELGGGDGDTIHSSFHKQERI